MNVFPLIRNTALIKSGVMFRFILISAPPGKGNPGAAAVRSSRGWRLVSTSRIPFVVCEEIGSVTDAPLYLRIAELIPPAKPFGSSPLPELVRARIQ